MGEKEIAYIDKLLSRIIAEILRYDDIDMRIWKEMLNRSAMRSNQLHQLKTRLFSQISIKIERESREQAGNDRFAI